jgi:hypothetical protein
MSTRIERLALRDRLLATRVSTRELERIHRAARCAGLTLADFVRFAAQAFARDLERERRDEEARS